MTNASKFDEYFLHEFWTNLEEMVDELNDYAGYPVLDYNDEYITVVNPQNEDEEIIFYLGHANNTIWIEKVR